jgi:hypothetical protein
MTRIGENNAIFQQIERLAEVEDGECRTASLILEVGGSVLGEIGKAEGGLAGRVAHKDLLHGVGREKFTGPGDALIGTVDAVATLDSAIKTLTIYRDLTKNPHVSHTIVRLKAKRDDLLDNVRGVSCELKTHREYFGQEGVDCVKALASMAGGVKVEHAVAILRFQTKLGISDDQLKGFLQLTDDEANQLFMEEGSTQDMSVSLYGIDVKLLTMSEAVMDVASQKCSDPIKAGKKVEEIIKGDTPQEFKGREVSTQLFKDVGKRSSMVTLNANGKTVSSGGVPGEHLDAILDGVGAEVDKTDLDRKGKKALHLAVQTAVSQAVVVQGLSSFSGDVNNFAFRIGTNWKAGIGDEGAIITVSKVPDEDAIQVQASVTFELDPVGSVEFVRDYTLSIGDDGNVEVSKYSMVPKLDLVTAGSVLEKRVQRERAEHVVFLNTAFQKGMNVPHLTGRENLQAQVNENYNTRAQADPKMNKDFVKDIVGFRCRQTVDVGKSDPITIKVEDDNIEGTPQQLHESVAEFAQDDEEALALQFLLSNAGNNDAPACLNTGAHFVDPGGENPLAEYGAWENGDIHTKYSRNDDDSVHVVVESTAKVKFSMIDSDEKDEISLKFAQSYDLKRGGDPGPFTLDNYETPTMEWDRA